MAKCRRPGVIQTPSSLLDGESGWRLRIGESISVGLGRRTDWQSVRQFDGLPIRPTPSRARAEESGDPELEKESWVSSVLLEWGSCGKIAYVNGVPAGFMLFAPPQYVPRSMAFPTSPVSADAVLFMTAHLLSEFAGGGIGRMLVQAMAKDLTRRGVKAIEAFGDRRWEAPSCMLPVDYLLAVGFKTIRPHHHYPRLRMELRTILTWREDVEVALERLLGSMTPSTPRASCDPSRPG